MRRNEAANLRETFTRYEHILTSSEPLSFAGFARMIPQSDSLLLKGGNGAEIRLSLAERTLFKVKPAPR